MRDFVVWMLGRRMKVVMRLVGEENFIVVALM